MKEKPISGGALFVLWGVGLFVVYLGWQISCVPRAEQKRTREASRQTVIAAAERAHAQWQLTRGNPVVEQTLAPGETSPEISLRDTLWWWTGIDEAADHLFNGRYPVSKDAGEQINFSDYLPNDVHQTHLTITARDTPVNVRLYGLFSRSIKYIKPDDEHVRVAIQPLEYLEYIFKGSGSISPCFYRAAITVEAGCATINSKSSGATFVACAGRAYDPYVELNLGTKARVTHETFYIRADDPRKTLTLDIRTTPGRSRFSRRGSCTALPR